MPEPRGQRLWPRYGRSSVLQQRKHVEQSRSTLNCSHKGARLFVVQDLYIKLEGGLSLGCGIFIPGRTARPPQVGLVVAFDGPARRGDGRFYVTRPEDGRCFFFFFKQKTAYEMRT